MCKTLGIQFRIFISHPKQKKTLKKFQKKKHTNEKLSKNAKFIFLFSLKIIQKKNNNIGFAATRAPYSKHWKTVRSASKLRPQL